MFLWELVLILEIRKYNIPTLLLTTSRRHAFFPNLYLLKFQFHIWDQSGTPPLFFFLFFEGMTGYFLTFYTCYPKRKYMEVYKQKQSETTKKMVKKDTVLRFAVNALNLYSISLLNTIFTKIRIQFVYKLKKGKKLKKSLWPLYLIDFE